MPPTRPVLRARYERRRDAVIATAAELFAERGFQATSIEDLSAATGLATGGLYHYIGSKEQLLLAILRQLMDPLLERARVIERSSDPAPERLRTLIRDWLAHVVAHQHHMIVFAQERHTIEREEHWSEVRASRREFEEILGRVLADVRREADDRLTLLALLGMVNHTATWFRPDGRFSAEQIADAYCDLVFMQR